MAKVSEIVRTTLTSETLARKAPGYHLAKMFRESGVKVLGDGMYGAAIEDRGEVFKIFGAQELGYNRYLQFLKGKSSVLLPRVKTVGQFGPYTCVHIERLYNLREIGFQLEHDLSRWIEYVAKNYAFKKYGLGRKPDRYRFPQEAAQYVNKANMIGILKKMVDWAANNGLEEGIDLDLHNGNFMVRKNEDGSMQVVITDPFCDK